MPLRVGLALLAVLILGLAFRPPAEAAPPCHVPGDYATIQEALDAVEDDGVPSCTTIKVAAGTYDGPITIARTVTIRGAGVDETRLVGGGPVVIIDGGLVTITGVTIQGGGPAGGGLYNERSAVVTVQNSTLTGNGAPEGGADIFNEGRLTLTRVTVDDCVDNGAIVPRCP